ncbi:phospholipid phosphatase 6 [Larimichthys crocea]|uniref:phospholipid phosphatase 6 n=1 Tax=Larimichthys crocea TaxID=215358 RepID=UPI000F5E971F|nr:phospholipid phosphatase 6 [Larimichthys crocea]
MAAVCSAGTSCQRAALWCRRPLGTKRQPPPQTGWEGPSHSLQAGARQTAEKKQDLWLSKRLGVCACEESPWGSIRPLVRLVEFSGHVIPWLVGTVYTLLRGENVAEQEIMLNLALALLLDLLLVRVVKTLVRRRMPVQNRSDILSTFFVERYSFPSGHATRAAMCARFLLAQQVDTASMRVLVVGWATLVSLSRLLLARHYVTDVGFGLAMGYCQYSLVERLWVTWDCLQDILLMRLRERLNRAYGGLWMADWKH